MLLVDSKPSHRFVFDSDAVSPVVGQKIDALNDRSHSTMLVM
jgi:hypothetical protein